MADLAIVATYVRTWWAMFAYRAERERRGYVLLSVTKDGRTETFGTIA